MRGAGGGSWGLRSGDTGARLLRDCRPQQSSSEAPLSEAPGVGFNRTPAPGREQMLRKKEKGWEAPPYTEDGFCFRAQCPPGCKIGL